MSIVIGKLIFAACVGLIVAGMYYYAYYRIADAKQEAAEMAKTNESQFNKQQFVKDNRDIFGINDKECGDIKEIYTVSPQTMGF